MGDRRSGLRRWLRRRRVHVPTVLQMEAAECGAACLAMVLAHHGRWLPLEILRSDCGVSRDGTNAANLLTAARSYGLEARGFKKELDGLRDLPLPMVLFWNFNHFIVLEGLGRRHAWINDPAFGRRRVSMAELDEAFTGVVLTFEPGPSFKGGDERPSMLRSVARRLHGAGGAVAFIALAGLGLMVPGLVIPSFARVFVDEILVGGVDDWLKALLGGLALTALLRGLLTWMQERALLRLESRIALATSASFLWHVLRLPIDFFNQRMPGELANRTDINFRVARLLAGELAGTMLSVLLIVFYALLMVRYDMLLTVIGVTFAVINVGAVRIATRRRAEQSMALLQEHGKMHGVAVGGLGMIETLKAMGAEGEFFSRWAGHHAKTVNARQTLAVSTQLLDTLPGFLDMVATLAVLSIGAVRVMEGHLTMGMLVAFQSLLASFMAPVNGLVGLGGAIQELQADMTRLDDVLRYEPELPDEAPAVPERKRGRAEEARSTRLGGSVALRGATFGYSRLAPAVVTDLDLTVEAGSRVALVGASGSGKSTVARLIAGLHTPWSGSLLFDGVARDALPRPLLTDSIAVVSQDINLFEGTIRDNLTLWDPSVSDAAIVQAARDACLHEDISARPGGYDGRVEEAGANFSGGQRQRLELARALVGDPSVLVLDEATSALDPITEKQVDDNLRRRGCTCIIVAHRLSTIRDADEIVVLHEGRVAERGRHEELLSKGGAYAHLVQEA